MVDVNLCFSFLNGMSLPGKTNKNLADHCSLLMFAFSKDMMLNVTWSLKMDAFDYVSSINRYCFDIFLPHASDFLDKKSSSKSLVSGTDMFFVACSMCIFGPLPSPSHQWTLQELFQHLTPKTPNKLQQCHERGNPEI